MDKLIEQLPYFDGSGRRRFVAGGIVLFGICLPNWHLISTALGIESVSDAFGSPTLVAGILLFVYALGRIVELVGDFFLVRSASGVFMAGFAFYRSVIRAGKSMRKFGKCCLALLNRNRESPTDGLGFGSMLIAIVVLAFNVIWLLPNMIYKGAKGFVGLTDYTIGIGNRLSQDGQQYFNQLPHKVKEGLTSPVGNSAELAIKVVIDELEDPEDKKWARKSVQLAKDVSSITTALVIIAMGIVGSRLAEPGDLELYGALTDLLDAIEELDEEAELPAAYTVDEIEQAARNEKLDTLNDSDFEIRYLSARAMTELLEKYEAIEAALDELDWNELSIGRIDSLLQKISRSFEADLAEYIRRITKLNDTHLEVEDRLAIQLDALSDITDELRNRDQSSLLDELTTDYFEEVEEEVAEALAEFRRDIGFVRSKLKNAETALNSVQAQNNRSWASYFFLLSPIAFLFLYIGFFNSLRNAVFSIVELGAIRQKGVFGVDS